VTRRAALTVYASGGAEMVGPGPLLVVPGVRPAGAARGDQARVATPEEAVRAGADVIVLGRPLRDAPDPAAAAREIAASIG
jgi:orotidine-5'-phosphate decarboxylase